MDVSSRRLPEFQVVIIVNCEDNRLSPLADDKFPRCLLPIANRCLLFYQLEVLEKSGAQEVFIVAEENYSALLSTKIATFASLHMTVELVVANQLKGSADGLRAVKDKIKGDFICIASDCLLQFAFGPIVNYHRRNANDVTVVLAGVPIDEPDKKGGIRKIRVEKDDQEIIGICEDSRIVYKQSALELEDNENRLDISKYILHQCKAVTMRNDCVDTEVYVFSHWIINLLTESKYAVRNIDCLKTDLLPYLINRQFQSEDFLAADIPTLKYRNRNLSSVEKWYTNKAASINKSSVELCDSVSESVFGGSILGANGNSSGADVSSTVLASTVVAASTDVNVDSVTSACVDESNNSALNASANGNVLCVEGYQTEASADLIRVYSFLFEQGGALPPQMAQQTYPFAVPFFCRITQVPTYISLNRDVPLMVAAAGSSGLISLWTPVTGYLVKEQSVVGEGSALAEKGTIKQCTVGNNCNIGAKTKLNNSVIMEGATIGEGCTIQNSVICFGAVIENNCNLNKCYVGAGAKVAASSKRENETF